MHLLIVGLNHKSTPLELREKLSFSSPALCAFLGQIHSQAEKDHNQDDNLYESVVVSTCNRLEYYALVQKPKAAIQKIINLISDACNVPAETFKTHLYTYQNEAAVNHLMQVAAGLDSMVLGESQILGQLVQAYESAATYNTARRVLSRVFQMAIHAGKRARTETDIDVNATSVSSVAVNLAQQHLGDLSDKVVMILGAGEMGSLTLKAITKWGAKELIVVNRTKERAEKLATEWGATPFTFDYLEDALTQADLVITSTGAPHQILRYNQVQRVMKTRPERSLLIIDIALPRDVETTVGNLEDVHLYNLDTLNTQVADNLKAREQEIPKVETILLEETTAFMNWYHSLNVVPTITCMRQQFEEIRQQELSRTLNKLGDLTEKEQKIITELSRRLTNKFLHQPTVRLRAEAARGNGVSYTNALQDLFDLEINPL